MGLAFREATSHLFRRVLHFMGSLASLSPPLNAVTTKNVPRERLPAGNTHFILGRSAVCLTCSSSQTYSDGEVAVPGR